MVASLFVRGVRVRDVLLVVVVVVALVELGVESVVIGGCGWRCRPLVKRPCRNMFGLGRHCSRRSRGAVVAGVGFGSRGVVLEVVVAGGALVVLVVVVVFVLASVVAWWHLRLAWYL